MSCLYASATMVSAHIPPPVDLKSTNQIDDHLEIVQPLQEAD